jgi:hypothetical protein
LVRQERTRPLVEARESWLRIKLQFISQKTKLAEAIRYTLSRWQGLCLFLDDGRIEIDSNVVERTDQARKSTRRPESFVSDVPVPPDEPSENHQQANDDDRQHH